jgi:D-glycero-D-manno-heptose 1,7-bisphosphate phosphatase
MKPAVFLDRDGVINRAVVRNGRPYPPDTIEEFEFLPGVPEALAALKRAGFLLVVATNQPDVATGKQRRDVVEAMHDRIRDELPVDDIFACYEVDSPECRCYKPKPGMLLDAAGIHGIDLGRSYMVGDRWRDVGAGKAAGCVTVFIDYGYEERRPDAPDFVVKSLIEASRAIVLNLKDDPTP